MKMSLTQFSDGKELVVETDKIALMETLADGSTHLVFASDMGRTVKESVSQIKAMVGAVSLPVMPALPQMK